MEPRKYKRAGTWLIVTAILTIIQVIPFLSMFLTLIFIGIPSLIVLGIAIPTLVFVSRAQLNKVGAILSVVANGIGFISGLMIGLTMYGAVMSGEDTDYIAETMFDGSHPIASLGLIIGLIAYILNVVALIVLFINYAKARRLYREAVLNEYSPVSYAANARKAMAEFTYRAEKDPTVLQQGNVTVGSQSGTVFDGKTTTTDTQVPTQQGINLGETRSANIDSYLEESNQTFGNVSSERIGDQTTVVENPEVVVETETVAEQVTEVVSDVVADDTGRSLYDEDDTNR